MQREEHLGPQKLVVYLFLPFICSHPFCLELRLGAWGCSSCLVTVRLVGWEELRVRRGGSGFPLREENYPQGSQATLAGSCR